MAKMIRIATKDEGVIWFNADDVVYIRKDGKMYDSKGSERDISTIFTKTGYRFKAFGTPDSIMMHVIGT